MRIALIHPQGGSVGYYRSDLPTTAMRRAGVNARYLHGPKIFEDPERWLLDHSKQYDAMHLGYLTNHNILQLFAAAREYANIPLLADIDDDIHNVPSYNIAYEAYHGGAAERRVCRMHLRISDGVSVSTPPLAEVLADDSNHITVLPNCVDPTVWDYPTDPKRGRDEAIRFMFAGNIGRYGDITSIQEALTKAMDQHPNLRLFFMGCMPDWITPWMESTTDPHANRVFFIRASGLPCYRAILRWISPDVFFSPVEENKFNESKSHIKAYDAAMAGATFLCTDWPTYADVPTTGAIKVSGNYEWGEAITELINNSSMRKRLREELYTWAIDQWHVDKHVDKWVSFYERAIAKGPVRDLSGIVRPGGQDGVDSGDPVRPVRPD